jgi:hypothetical protein
LIDLVAIAPARGDAVQLAVGVAQRIEQPQTAQDQRDNDDDRSDIGTASWIVLGGRQIRRHGEGFRGDDEAVKRALGALSPL